MLHGSANVDRRYIATLCVVSIFILVAGVWFRPSRTPPPMPSEYETLNVQLERQREDLERRSLFYAKTASDLMRVAADVRTHPDNVPVGSISPGEIALLVASDPQGRLVWASSQTAGTTEASCPEGAMREIATTIVIP